MGRPRAGIRSTINALLAAAAVGTVGFIALPSASAGPNIPITQTVFTPDEPVFGVLPNADLGHGLVFLDSGRRHANLTTGETNPITLTTGSSAAIAVGPESLFAVSESDSSTLERQAVATGTITTQALQPSGFVRGARSVDLSHRWVLLDGSNGATAQNRAFLHDTTTAAPTTTDDTGLATTSTTRSFARSVSSDGTYAMTTEQEIIGGSFDRIVRWDTSTMTSEVAERPFWADPGIPWTASDDLTWVLFVSSQADVIPGLDATPRVYRRHRPSRTNEVVPVEVTGVRTGTMVVTDGGRVFFGGAPDPQQIFKWDGFGAPIELVTESSAGGPAESGSQLGFVVDSAGSRVGFVSFSPDLVDGISGFERRYFTADLGPITSPVSTDDGFTMLRAVPMPDDTPMLSYVSPDATTLITRGGFIAELVAIVNTTSGEVARPSDIGIQLVSDDNRFGYRPRTVTGPAPERAKTSFIVTEEFATGQENEQQVDFEGTSAVDQWSVSQIVAVDPSNRFLALVALNPDISRQKVLLFDTQEGELVTQTPDGLGSGIDFENVVRTTHDPLTVTFTGTNLAGPLPVMYQYDLLTGARTALDRPEENVGFGPWIASPELGWVLFESSAANVLPGLDARERVYRRNVTTGTTDVVPIDSLSEVDITDTGRVVFIRNAPTNGSLLRQLLSWNGGEVSQLNATLDGEHANGPVGFFDISADGETITYSSGATNLIVGSTSQVFQGSFSEPTEDSAAVSGPASAHEVAERCGAEC